MRAPRVSILAFIADVATPIALEATSSLIMVGQPAGWQTVVAMAVLTIGVFAVVAALDTPAVRATIRRREGRR